MSYPIKLSDQIKFLKENKDFFLTFGPYTEPYKDKLIAKVVNEIKEKDIPALYTIKDVIKRNFKKVNIDPNYIFTVKFMEDHRVVGACTEHSLLTAAILRKLGYPTAIVYSINLDVIFQDPVEYKSEGGHATNLVYYDGSWWLLDSTGVISKPTRFIFTRLFHAKFIPGIILRDPVDIGIKNRFDEFYYALYNLKDILLLDLQEDIVDFTKLLNLRFLESKLSNSL